MKKAALLALLLAGCQTTDERLMTDDRTCRSYGVAVGSPAYVDCRARLDQNRSDRLTAERLNGGLINAIKSANE